MRCLVALTLLLMALQAGASLSEADVGGWQTVEGQANERDILMVKRLEDGRYAVNLHTTYCPSAACMNARLGSLTFYATVRDNTLRFRKGPCTIRLTFQGTIATAELSECDEHFPYGGPRGPLTKFTDDPDWAGPIPNGPIEESDPL